MFSWKGLFFIFIIFWCTCWNSWQRLLSLRFQEFDTKATNWTTVWHHLGIYHNKLFLSHNFNLRLKWRFYTNDCNHVWTARKTKPQCTVYTFILISLKGFSGGHDVNRKNIQIHSYILHLAPCEPPQYQLINWTGLPWHLWQPPFHSSVGPVACPSHATLRKTEEVMGSQGYLNPGMWTAVAHKAKREQPLKKEMEWARWRNRLGRWEQKSEREKWRMTIRSTWKKKKQVPSHVWKT